MELLVQFRRRTAAHDDRCSLYASHPTESAWAPVPHSVAVPYSAPLLVSVAFLYSSPRSPFSGIFSANQPNPKSSQSMPARVIFPTKGKETRVWGDSRCLLNIYPCTDGAVPKEVLLCTVFPVPSRHRLPFPPIPVSRTSPCPALVDVSRPSGPTKQRRHCQIQIRTLPL